MNELDAMYEQACIETPRDKYYTKFFRTIIDCNDCNLAPFSNEKVWDEIHSVITEEEADTYNITSDAHNVTVDTFSQTPVHKEIMKRNIDKWEAR